MSEQEVAELRAIVEECCGVFHGVDSPYKLERRLGPRVRALGLRSFREYARYLREAPDGRHELEEVIEELTTHETYFFREQFQLDVFCRDLLPELAERRRMAQRLTIWSAGCSSGEEVYTIAMLLLQSGLFPAWAVDVIGLDISRKVLSSARYGVYSPSSFRSSNLDLAGRFLTEREDKDGQILRRVSDEVRSICSFRQVNLIDNDAVAALGAVDLIFCRNVLIYMSPGARDRIVDAFFDALAPGGYLLLGHSESLLNLETRFEHVHLDGDLVYRRPPT
ncbi:MAG TPA: protein-glutamate O-methyltransferase CheR [Nannocystis exedens]|nr:protein-glutamate O-methyltransferase CheR [Nannocystis exedens]